MIIKQKDNTVNCRVAIGVSSFSVPDRKPIEILESAGVTVIQNPYGRRLAESEIISHLSGVDGLIAGLEPLNRNVLQSAPSLKAIARVGIGMDNIDMEAANELGILVSNTPDGPTEAVAEMCLTALLALLRRLVSINSDMHRGRWRKQVGMSLSGKNVLLVGYGRIGRRFGEFLRFLGANLFVSDPVIKKEDLRAGEHLVSLEEGIKETEVISLHASGMRTILGEAQFKKMRTGTTLLNSARGELIDEDALISAIENGIVKAAWLDVFQNEPYSGRLTEFDQVLLTPHISTYTVQCRRSMEEAAVKNLLRDLGV